MKTKIQFALMAVLALTISASAYAQNKKKYSIYIDMNKNGKEITIDTSFASREEMEAFMKSNGFEVPAVPPPPAVPAVPGVPAVPPVPPVPPIPDNGNMKQIMIEIDDVDFSSEGRAEVEKAMQKAEKEMRKARSEMKISKKEMDQLQEEMKNMQIEIERSGDNGNKVIIREFNDEKSSGDGERKMMFINIEDEDTGNGQVRVIRMNCDTLVKGDKEFTFIRKVKETGAKQEEAILEDVAQTPVVAEVVNVEEKSAPSSEPADYQLRVSDFKLYPNPTAGKLNISFQSESSGKTQIRLLDGSGKVVIEDVVDVQNGFFSKEYSIEGKSRGTYLLQIKQGDKWKHEKVVLK